MNEFEPEHAKAPIWLVTFGDVIALLLTFFVMLYATARIPSEDWDAVVGTLSQSLRFSQSGMAPNPQSDVSIPITQLQPALSTEYLSGILREQLGGHETLRDTVVRLQDNRVSLSVASGTMFAPGDDEPSAEAKASIVQLGGVFSNIVNQLEIRGHAGRSADEGEDFEENQRLSLRRAETVAQILHDTGYERNIIVLGLGDSRFERMDPRIGAEQREALSRRVDFIVHGVTEN
ncbi:MAG: flagellar motor protein MotB [Alphaproteobacteria bacterium]